jgi:hypothetical protein
VVAVFVLRVYVAQKGPTIEDDRMNSRRQLLWLQWREVLVVADVSDDDVPAGSDAD